MRYFSTLLVVMQLVAFFAKTHTLSHSVSLLTLTTRNQCIELTDIFPVFSFASWRKNARLLGVSWEMRESQSIGAQSRFMTFYYSNRNKILLFQHVSHFNFALECFYTKIGVKIWEPFFGENVRNKGINVRGRKKGKISLWAINSLQSQSCQSKTWQYGENLPN